MYNPEVLPYGQFYCWTSWEKYYECVYVCVCIQYTWIELKNLCEMITGILHVLLFLEIWEYTLDYSNSLGSQKSL